MRRCEWCDKRILDGALVFRVEVLRHAAIDDTLAWLCTPQCLARYACDIAKMRAVA